MPNPTTIDLTPDDTEAQVAFATLTARCSC